MIIPDNVTVESSDTTEPGGGFEHVTLVGENIGANTDSDEVLFNEFTTFATEHDAYTIKKTDDGGFELTKNTKDASVKVFKMEDGHCKVGLPIDDEVLKLYFEANLKKDIIVNKCETVEAAIKLAEVAKESGVNISFNQNVLNSLVDQQNQKEIKPEYDVLARLKEILGPDDISHGARHKLRA